MEPPAQAAAARGAAGGDYPEDYVFSPRTRRSATRLALAAVPLAGLAAVPVDGARGYLTAWAAVALPYVVPSAALQVASWRRTIPASHRPMASWYLGWWMFFVGTAAIYLAAVHGWHPGRGLFAVAIGVGLAGYGFANVWSLRMRSGQRDVAIDLVDVLIATVATVGPVALFVGEPIATSEHAWLTIPLAAAVAGGTCSTGTYVLMVLRQMPEHRSHIGRRLVFTVIVLVELSGELAQALSGFTLPAAPFVALHALLFASAVDVAAHLLHDVPEGLGRLPPQRQVRKNVVLAPLVASSVALIVAVAAWRSDEGWVVATAVGLLGTLAVALVLRVAWLGAETTRLYSGVERTAEERRELLAELMRYLDGERPRAAAELHQQVTALYAAMALSGGAENGIDLLRTDLARRSDASRDMLHALGASVIDQPVRDRVAALTRAYVGTLYGDARQPGVEVSIEPGIALDWADEAVALRVVEVAVENAWRHADAGAIEVALAVEDRALVVEVRDDGAGFRPEAVVPGAGIAMLRNLAELAGGRLDIDSAPGEGTRVRAVLRACSTPTPADGPRRPRLRLVSSASEAPPRQRT